MFIPVNELPPEGARFTLDDQGLWLDRITAFNLNCGITSPLTARVEVIPAEDGCLVRGRLTGALVMPCNRCAEDASVSIAADFDEFEPLPLQEDGRAALQSAEESRVVIQEGQPTLDLGALCWEEFLLSLPIAPLCRPDCKGICPDCGANLNSAPCACARDEPDPRFAVLRDLKIHKR